MQMSTTEDVLKFLDENGYYIATFPDQQILADKLVLNGKLRRVDSSWFSYPIGPSLDNVYVHPWVDRRCKLPMSLWPRVYETPDFYKNEVVMLDAEIKGSPYSASIYVKVERKLPKNRYEVVVLGTGSTLLVEESDLFRTFDFKNKC